MEKTAFEIGVEAGLEKVAISEKMIKGVIKRTASKANRYTPERLNEFARRSYARADRMRHGTFTPQGYHKGPAFSPTSNAWLKNTVAGTAASQSSRKLKGSKYQQYKKKKELLKKQEDRARQFKVDPKPLPG